VKLGTQVSFWDTCEEQGGLVKARKPIFIHYVHDMRRGRQFYEGVFAVLPSFASKG
jgi:hypothetical protein